MPSQPLPSLRRRHLSALLMAALAARAVPAQPAAGAWPQRTVKLLVGFPGGSTPDMAARVLAEGLARVWGRAVIVDNRPGAAGNLAAAAVAQARDEHTLGVVINGNLTTARLLNPRLPFDPAHDFTLISLLATSPLVLVAPAGLPGGAAYFAAARQAAGQWNFGSVGIGSVGHLGMELMQGRAGFSATHVPYNGNPAVLTALVAGQVQGALVPPGLAMPLVRAGRLRAIGLTGRRSVLAPEVPPLAEAGVRMDELEVWTALVGPAGLTAAAQLRLAQDVPAVLRAPAARQRLFDAGWQLQATSAEALRLRVQAEGRLLGAIVASRGIRAE
ncbi:MAG: tripartite tricarboxylate transporter substrate-binding protein [Rubrivivax sp.]|nr:tripartite tricarboxylate transporter substrate-binding protein [Rubrivivax sp.]